MVCSAFGSLIHLYSVVPILELISLTSSLCDCVLGTFLSLPILLLSFFFYTLLFYICFECLFAFVEFLAFH